MKRIKNMKKVLNTFLCISLVSVSAPMRVEAIYAKDVEKLAVDYQSNSFTAELLQKNYNNVNINLSDYIDKSSIKVSVVRKGEVIEFNNASSENIYGDKEYFLGDNHTLTTSKLQNNDVIVISNNNSKKYFQYKDGGLLSSDASLNEIQESEVDIDKELIEGKTYSFSDIRLETSLIGPAKITGNGSFEKISKVFVNDIELDSVNNRYGLVDGKYHKTGNSVEIQKLDDRDKVVFKSSDNEILGAYRYVKRSNSSNNSFIPIDVDNNKSSVSNYVVKIQETDDEKTEKSTHKYDEKKVNKNDKIKSITGSEEGNSIFDKYYVIDVSTDDKHLLERVNNIDIDGKKYSMVTSKNSVFGLKFFKEGSKIYLGTNEIPKDGQTIAFKDSENEVIGTFKKTKEGYLNNEISSDKQVEESSTESTPVTKHTYKEQKADEKNKIKSITGREDREGFNNYYIIDISSKNNDLIGKIEKIDINGKTYTATSYKSSVWGEKFYKNESKIYFDTHSEPKEKQIISFKDSNNTIMGSFEKTKDGYVDVDKKEKYKNSDKKELKVKIKGKFEAAITGQKKYDAISGATGTVTNVKNSNVNVYLQEVEHGQEPLENAWKLVKESGIHIVKGGEKTSRGTIKESGSGMRVGYNPYESSLVLQGIPDKEGDYNIFVTVVDENGRVAQSNELPFRIYNLNKVKLIDQLAKKNFEKFPNGEKYKWDMEPWEIHTFGGTNETVTIPEELKAWFGSHESGTYGYLGRPNEEKETSIRQTIIIPEGKDFSFVNMQLLTSVDVIVKKGAKLNINDSAIYGNIIVENGGILQINYNEREKKLTTGSSINGKIILKEGAILENSAIYSNTNAVTDGKKANKNTDPVVEVEGDAIIRGNVFIRGDESPTGNDSKGVPFTGQKALRIKNAKLTVEKDATLGLYGGGKFATTTNGGDALVLDGGTVDGQGTLIAVGGTGSGLSNTKKGGDAVSGKGDILVDKAYLQGGYSSSNSEDTFGKPFTEKIRISNETIGEAKNGKSTSSLVNTTIPNEYWGNTVAPGNDKNHNPLDFTKVVGTETIVKKLKLTEEQIVKKLKQEIPKIEKSKADVYKVEKAEQDDTQVEKFKHDISKVENIESEIDELKKLETDLPNKRIKRFSGKNRIGTSVEVSKNNFKTSESVIIARSDIYPDTLSASMLSKVKKSPILLTPSDKLEDIVEKEIERLGSENVIILGGDVSISKNVEKSLGEYNIERLSGKDRYETSANIARKLARENNINSKAIIVSGETWADALAAGSFAGKENHPILLVKKNYIPESVKKVIKALNIKDFYIVGGKSRIGDGVRKQLPNIIKEFSGKDRYETSRKLAEYGFKSSESVYLTSGQNFADSIVIGGVAGMNDAPIILTNGKTLEKETRNYMDKLKIKNINIVGGTKMISDEFEKNTVISRLS